MNTPKTETISYDNEEENLHLSVTISRATAEMGMVKTLLSSSAREFAEEIKDFSDVRKIAKRLTISMVYPSLVSAAVENVGFITWPPSYEEFLNLPDTFISEWERKTYELNSHWRPRIAPTPEEKKTSKTQVTNSTSD